MDKTNLSKKAGLLMAGCLITFNAFGQATIKGQVVDATGEPVIGASILVKDTKNGAVSDLYNPQNEMLPFHKTKCSETQNEMSSL